MTAVAVLALTAVASPAFAQVGADINNGTVRLGVNNYGGLNIATPTTVPLMSAGGTNFLSLRYMPTNNEMDAVAPQEGWGIVDTISGNKGFCSGGGAPTNLVLGPFSSTATTATSTVTAGGVFKVTHAFSPSTNPNFYVFKATVQNISAATANVHYRRAFDWDIEAAAPSVLFQEFITIHGSTQPGVIDLTNGPYPSWDPTVAPPGVNGDVVNEGPNDFGYCLDMNLGSLAPGASTSFNMYYGVAGDRPTGQAAITALGLQIYAIGEPSATPAANGAPNVVMFAAGPATPTTPPAPSGGAGEGSFAGAHPDPAAGSSGEGGFGFGGPSTSPSTPVNSGMTFLPATPAAMVTVAPATPPPPAAGEGGPILSGPFLDAPASGNPPASPALAAAPPPGTSLLVFNTGGEGGNPTVGQQATSGAGTGLSLALAATLALAGAVAVATKAVPLGGEGHG